MTARKPKHLHEKTGRPSKYNEEVSQVICDLTAVTPRSLDYICEQNPELPHVSTIRLWMVRIPEFSEKYLVAKKAQANLLIDETLELAAQRSMYVDGDGNQKVDPGSVAANKLQINNSHWHASRMMPWLYGDKQQIETLTTDNETLKKEIADIRAELDAKNKKDY